jgi:hypothetical protein
MHSKRVSPSRSPMKSPKRRTARRTARGTVRGTARGTVRRTPGKSPKKSSFSTAVAKFISVLFHSRTQAHILHLQTKSFAAHKALNAYYDGIVPLVDKYAESYQGIYGIVKGYQSMPKVLEGQKEIIPYFNALDKQITLMKNKLPKDLDLENAYADILDLIHSTQYLLKELH